MQPKRSAMLWPCLMLSLSFDQLRVTLPSVVQPAKIPAPPPELMEPEDLSGELLDIVRSLLQTLRGKLTDWKRSL